MYSESTRKLLNAIEVVSEARGAENVRLVHSVLVEACKFLEERLGENFYDKIMKLRERHMIDEDVVGITRDMYYLFGANIVRVSDEPDAPLDMQRELPFGISEILEQDGLSEEEVCEIFSQGIKNVDKNRLSDVYKDNFYVKRDG